MNFVRSSMLVIVSFALAACGNSSGNGDLRKFMQESLDVKPRAIQPLPEFKPYEAFSYSASSKRSPFETPVDVKRRLEKVENTVAVAPDFNRPKDPLESYSIGSMSLVGSLQLDGAELRALLKVDGVGVFRVREGDYLGKNHGRVVAIDNSQMSLIEIVPDGVGGWIERPRTFVLRGSGE